MWICSRGVNAQIPPAMSAASVKNLCLCAGRFCSVNAGQWEKGRGDDRSRVPSESTAEKSFKCTSNIKEAIE